MNKPVHCSQCLKGSPTIGGIMLVARTASERGRLQTARLVEGATGYPLAGVPETAGGAR